MASTAVSLALPLALLLATPASGQVQIRVFVHETLTAQVGSTTRTLAPGTELTNGGGVMVTGPACLSPNDTSALAWVYRNGDEVLFDAGLFGPAWCAINGSASGAVRVRLTSPAPVLATIDALAYGGSTGTGGGSVEVVGGQRIVSSFSPSFVVQAELEEVVLIDGSGVDVIITGSGGPAFLGGGTNGGGRVRIATAGTRLTAAGTACGPSLRAHYISEWGLGGERRELGLHVTNSAVTPFAYFVFGTQGIQVSIPPLGCVLRTNIAVPVLTTVGPGGATSVTLGVPPAIPALDVRAQFLAANAAQHWTTSEVIRLQLP